MKTVSFESSLASELERFVSLRRLSGADYSTQARLLSYFDRFLVNVDVEESRLTRELTERYQRTLTPLALRTRYNCFSVVRQFCEYLSQSDPLSYVPEPLREIRPQDARAPYIYTKSEVERLLAAAGELSPRDSLRPHTYRTLLGLLYSSGIRIGEAIALNLEDLHREGKLLSVREGKFRKARWLPLSDSSYRALESYVDKRIELSPALADSPLFLNLRGRRLHHSTVHHAFHDLLRRLEIRQKTSRPRIHDLRHTFAVHRLLEWYRQGEEINARLPSLSTYMGHVDVSSTQVYLRATPQLVERVDQRFQRYYRKHVKAEGDAV